MPIPRYSFVEFVEYAYTFLLSNAVHVADMPFETPLRWQQVYNFPINENNIHSKYIMIRFSDSRDISIQQNFYLPTVYDSRWEVKVRQPIPGFESCRKEITIRNIELDKPRIDIYEMEGKPGFG